MADDAARVVEEGDELCLGLAGAVLHVGAKQGVSLPELVHVRFGEGEATLALSFGVGLQKLVGFDDARKVFGAIRAR